MNKLRSQFEINFYNWLKTIDTIIKIEYEPDTFNIPYGYKLFFKYTPDFKITFKNRISVFIELKGWNLNRSLFIFKKRILQSYFENVLDYPFYVITAKSGTTRDKFYIWGNRLSYHDKHLFIKEIKEIACKRLK